MPSHEESCFLSIAQGVRVLCVFVYNAVDLKKIVAIYLARPLQNINVQLTLHLLLYFTQYANHR